MTLKSIKTLLFALSLSLIGATVIAPQLTYADDNGVTQNSSNAGICTSDVPDSVKAAAGCAQPGKTLEDVILYIVNVIIGVSGIVAVIFIVVGGVGYMTSAGDTTKLEKAKKTILYAAIGLIICALAFAIVNFVILNLLNEPTN